MKIYQMIIKFYHFKLNWSNMIRVLMTSKGNLNYCFEFYCNIAI